MVDKEIEIGTVQDLSFPCKFFKQDHVLGGVGFTVAVVVAIAR